MQNTAEIQCDHYEFGKESRSGKIIRPVTK